MSQAHTKRAPQVRPRFMGELEVLELVGVARSTLRAWEKSGAFPRRRQVGPARIAWLESDVMRWIESRPEAK